MSVAIALRFLDRADVVALGGADFRAAMADVRDALALFVAGDAAMPAETSVRLGAPEGGGRAYALPAELGGRFAAAGVKWTAHRPPLADGLPSIASLTLVSDRATGLPRGVVESALITAMRTAAVSAWALAAVAPAPVRRVVLLGAGLQARTHLAMLAAIHPGLDAVTVWNRGGDRARAMVEEREPLPWPVAVAPSLSDAIGGADAILACTAAEAPILGPEAIRRGRIVLQVGRHEAAFDAIDRAEHVVVDLWGEFRLTSAKSLFQMHRAGRFPAERVACDLAGAVIGGWRPRPGAAVYFSSFGLNLFDVALAAHLLDRAEAEGRGTPLPLFGKGGGGWPWR